ncbi:SDR family NAD(P)-dependent oxidoreductase [Sphingosinicella terrae]|uniref:SDR family NAD(P)-dependent oxidoreductase n=1 Tax=Sphingosinicella terrae TaxID=2172047 RepID=UPI000E0DE65B|nr:SDR family oxidoreductase [Sphingosinicella terrae]
MSGLFDLGGRTAIVTGGSRGIGLAIARAFGEAGGSVMIASEDAQACEAAQASLAREGLKAAWRRCEVTSETDQRALVEATVAIFGGLDILVCNAGISGPMKGSTCPDPPAYRHVMSINLDSVVQLCGFALPHLKARGGGSIILMSSIAGLRGNKALGPYAISKAALAQLARNLAVEHGPDNVRANALAPGFIRTDLAAALLADEAFMARRMQNTPLRRPGEVREVAGAALFLASPAGAFVTGQTLVVDGGTMITDGN